MYASEWQELRNETDRLLAEMEKLRKQSIDPEIKVRSMEDLAGRLRVLAQRIKQSPLVLTDLLKDPHVKQYVDELLVREKNAGASLDKAVMTLAGGALGLSIAFMRDLVPAPVAGSLPLLVWGWSMLCATLLSAMLGSAFGRWACRYELKKIYAGGGNGFPGGWWARVAEGLDILAMLSVVAGIALLAAFAGANMVPPGTT